MKLKTPYADLIPPLSEQEQERLKADIKANGVHTPIAVDEDGNVIDGHHRLKFCKNPPVIVVKDLADELCKRAEAYRRNLNRRNLSSNQKAEQDKKVRALAKEMNKKYSQPEIARRLGVPRQTVTYWLSITNAKVGNSNTRRKASASNEPARKDYRVKLDANQKREAIKQVRAGKSQTQVAANFGISQGRLSSIMKKDQEDAAQRSQRATPKETGTKHTLLHGDFRKVDVADRSVDWIITDPPYLRKYIHLFSDLSNFAKRVLRPGGGLIAMTGQSYLPDYVERLAEHLTYQWTCCYHTPGPSTSVTARKVTCNWKPLLFFVKGRYTGPTFNDHFVSDKRDKVHHDWGQSVSGMADIIKRVTSKSDVVCDPMMGAGTTGIACDQHGRTFIGIEKDKKAYDKARKRLG